MATSRVETTAVPVIATGLVASTANLLRFTTAGSVDDGKSTLIGRLLYDSQSVYEDQVASVRKSKINRSSGPLDFSLLTDGLRAEREQGITIDVAYRYFSTPRRKFIIADTPGHEQYTRNMATGASNADAAVVLLDATKGLLPQSRRHAYIASLLGIEHVVAAVNKMDLVGYSQEVFERISRDFRILAEKLRLRNVYLVPVSALEGDNVVRRSARMAWFEGPALLEHLEQIPLTQGGASGPMRFPVQYVSRPDAQFRGFAGQVVSGVLRAGMTVVALPSGARSKVKSIVTYDGELEEAGPGSSITVTLEDEIDISRGDMLAGEAGTPPVARKFAAKLVWMHSDTLDPRKLYLLKHTTRTVRARVSRIQHRVDVNSLEQINASTLEMNDIAAVEVETTLPLFIDSYRQTRGTGSFILIDPISNATVAAGMVEQAIEDASAWQRPVAAVRPQRVSREERHERHGHGPAAVWIQGRPELAVLVERWLFEENWQVQLVAPADFRAQELEVVAKAVRRAGAIAVFSVGEDGKAVEDGVRATFGNNAFFDATGLSDSDSEAAAQIIENLRTWRDAVTSSWRQDL